jgi:hypothetical protein
MAVDENGNEIIEVSDSEKRIKQLSSKVREEAEAREAANTARETAEAKAAEATRERDFYAGFTDVLGTNPEAKDHKDDIKAKVMAGYSVEDATFAVLGKAGKLGQPKTVESAPVAGGSAVINAPQGGGTKPIHEMSREEKRSALMEAEQRGDISLT